MGSLSVHPGICERHSSGGSMFAPAVIINVKPVCDFSRALDHHAMDCARHSEGAPAGARSSAISAVPLSVLENL
jgi:hypothetical protein